MWVWVHRLPGGQAWRALCSYPNLKAQEQRNATTTIKELDALDERINIELAD
jgi:ABC-type Zn uptake system ZnuABC Zn-binding protein ZnuA